MDGVETTHNSAESGLGRFNTTHWSVVLAAGGSDARLAARALERLCAAYWYPLYAYVRRRGHDVHEAQDLTQGFFAQLLEHQAFQALVPSRARFRSFLLVALQNHLADDHDRKQAQKRGGGKTIISFDAQAAEQRYQFEPAHSETPDKLFERRWATTLLDRTLEGLEREFVLAGKGQILEQLREFILEGATDRTYAQAGAQIGMSEGAVKKAVQRMRQRYRAILRAEIGHTVATVSEVEEELRHLWSVLGA
jgi:RNA polymerase sigma-70 factor (ECF subfamily)